MVRQKARSPYMGLPVGNALRLVAKRMVRHRIRASHYMADRASSLRSEIPLDLIHGIATTLFPTALYLPWKRKLERVKRKYYM